MAKPNTDNPLENELRAEQLRLSQELEAYVEHFLGVVASNKYDLAEDEKVVLFTTNLHPRWKRYLEPLEPFLYTLDDAVSAARYHCAKMSALLGVEQVKSTLFASASAKAALLSGDFALPGSAAPSPAAKPRIARTVKNVQVSSPFSTQAAPISSSTLAKSDNASSSTSTAHAPAAAATSSASASSSTTTTATATTKTKKKSKSAAKKEQQQHVHSHACMHHDPTIDDYDEYMADLLHMAMHNYYDEIAAGTSTPVAPKTSTKQKSTTTQTSAAAKSSNASSSTNNNNKASSAATASSKSAKNAVNGSNKATVPVDNSNPGAILSNQMEKINNGTGTGSSGSNNKTAEKKTPAENKKPALSSSSSSSSNNNNNNNAGPATTFHTGMMSLASIGQLGPDALKRYAMGKSTDEEIAKIKQMNLPDNRFVEFQGGASNTTMTDAERYDFIVTATNGKVGHTCSQHHGQVPPQDKTGKLINWEYDPVKDKTYLYFHSRVHHMIHNFMTNHVRTKKDIVYTHIPRAHQDVTLAFLNLEIDDIPVKALLAKNRWQKSALSLRIATQLDLQFDLDRWQAIDTEFGYIEQSMGSVTVPIPYGPKNSKKTFDTLVQILPIFYGGTVDMILGADFFENAKARFFPSKKIIEINGRDTKFTTGTLKASDAKNIRLVTDLFNCDDLRTPPDQRRA
ncbi:hypothetical protein BC940DRAFT_308431 [Gongronella butleri]|nr:hypothetical protein BC940DRAFT_308431 [Gongronella butleri]